MDIKLKDGRTLTWTAALPEEETGIEGGVPGHMTVDNGDHVSDSFPDDENDKQVLFETLEEAHKEIVRLTKVAAEAMKERDKKVVAVEVGEVNGSFGFVVTYPGHDETKLAELIASLIDLTAILGQDATCYHPQAQKTPNSSCEPVAAELEESLKADPGRVVPLSFDVELALKLNAMVHDECPGVKHDIGMRIAKYVVLHQGPGITALAAERRRQIMQEKFGAERDSQYTGGELADAAVVYASAASAIVRGARPREIECIYDGSMIDSPLHWPWIEDGVALGLKISPDPIRNMSKAGALLAAEIDRQVRAREGQNVPLPFDKPE